MKNLNLYVLGVIAILFSACSTNQDLAKLNEYDDVYYQGSPAVAQKSAPVSVNDNTLNDASDAERSYYQNAPYTENQTMDQDHTYNADSDYYDEGYANRIDNFHRPNDGDYVYSNSQNTSPSMSYSLGFGMGGYGSGMSMGMSYGSPGFYGSSMGMYNPYYMGYSSPYYMSPWYSPYYSPYSYRPYYGYGGYPSPFYYDPYPYYPSYGYGGGYYGGYYPPYYGGGVGGDYYGNASGITSTPRQNTGSVRPSRGGVITPSNVNGSGRSEMIPATASPNGNATRATTENSRSAVVDRSVQTELRGKDVQTREELRRDNGLIQPSGNQNYGAITRENVRPGTTRNDYIRSEQPVRQTRAITPSQTNTSNGSINFPSRATTPSQSPDTRTLAPATRSRAESINSNINRNPSGTMSSPASRGRSIGSSNPQRNMSPRQQATTPSQSYSSPSAPSRSSGGSFGGSGSGTSSPASAPSRGSRR